MAFSLWKETIYGPVENPLTVIYVPIHQALCSFFIHVAILYSSVDTRLILRRPPELSILERSPLWYALLHTLATVASWEH